ncbi:MAG: RIP metalloprotease RseP [candidate division WOR-3 bacterium]
MISSLLLVAVVIGSLITVHEFGHLIIAKLSKLPVETFSIGFGPVILKKKIGSTVYQLSLIPLGGFIKLTGDEIDSTTGFNAAPLCKKVAVIFAGPISNLILGVILTAILYAVFGVSNPEPRIIPETDSAKILFLNGDYIIKINQDTIKNWSDLENKFRLYANQTVTIIVQNDHQLRTVNYTFHTDSFPFSPFIPPIIDRVKTNGPAHKIGLKRGDKIIEVAGIPIDEWHSFVDIVRNAGGQKIAIKWQRQNQIFTDSIVPELVADEITSKKYGAIGIWVKLPEKPMPTFKAIGTATVRSLYVAEQTFVILYKIIVGQLPKSAIGGPVMVAKYTYEGAQWGIKYLLGLWALLSINLCVINIIPIPILDGGRILLYIIERVKGKKLSKKQWEIAFWIGYGLIGIILIFALTNDITRIIRR